MLHTFCDTYHVQFCFVTWKLNSLGLDPRPILIFKKDSTRG